MVKTFLWQACNNVFPTKELLFKWHIISDLLCPICCLATETIRHMLWSCPSAKDVWKECSPKIHKCTSDEIDFLHIMAKLMERLDQLQFVATVARQVWIRRKSIVFGGDMVDPSSLVRLAKD